MRICENSSCYPEISRITIFNTGGKEGKGQLIPLESKSWKDSVGRIKSTESPNMQWNLQCALLMLIGFKQNTSQIALKEN